MPYGGLLFALWLAVVPQAVPAVDMTSTFEAGETLDYEVTWMKITGGSARMTIAPSAGGDAWKITSVAKSNPRFSRIFKVRDEIETTVDRRDFSTLRYVKKLDEDGDVHQEVTVVEEGVATRTRKKVKKVPVPRPVYDPISVIYHLRRLDLAPSRSHDLTLIADGKVYTVQARVVRRETIETPAGRFATVMVEPVMKSAGVEREEKLFVWYSDDERRLPVRIRSQVKFGSVTISLRAVSRGVHGIEPQTVAAR